MCCTDHTRRPNTHTHKIKIKSQKALMSYKAFFPIILCHYDKSPTGQLKRGKICLGSWLQRVPVHSGGRCEEDVSNSWPRSRRQRALLTGRAGKEAGASGPLLVTAPANLPLLPRSSIALPNQHIRGAGHPVFEPRTLWKQGRQVASKNQ